jgi:cytochrome oxidase Cu insertion factor (SCO1/SenC/PrrC family)
MSSAVSAPAPERRPIHPLSIWIPVIIIALGLVIFWNYLVMIQKQKDAPRLPMISRLENNLVLKERSGKTVELKDLKGKVLVACWVYTHCPRGCPGVVGEMLRLYKDVGSDPNIHFLSFSVDPDDTPEALRAFTERFNIKGDNWWFVNGPKEEVRPYMTHYFRFNEVQDVPVADRMSPDDKFVHDMRVALVDAAGNVRGMYDIGAPDTERAKFFQEQIRKDIKSLLAERSEAQH